MKTQWQEIATVSHRIGEKPRADIWCSFIYTKGSYS